MKTTKQNRSVRKSHTPAATANSKDNLIVIARKKQNTLRAGTFTHAQVAAVQKANGKTVAFAQQVLDRSGVNPNKRRLEIFWLQKQGFAVFKDGKKAA